MTNFIVSAFWILLEVFTCQLFLDSLLNRKVDIYKIIMTYLLAWVFITIYSNLPIQGAFRQVLSIATHILLSLVLYKGSWLLHVLLVIVFYVFTAVCDTGIAYLVCAILGISLNALSDKFLLFCSVATLSKLLQLFFAFLLHHFNNKGKAKFSGERVRWLCLTALFPIVSAVIIVGIFFKAESNQDLSISALVFSGVICVANLAILYLIRAIENSSRKEQEAAVLQQKIHIQSQNFSALEAGYKQQRKVTHDFKRHLQVIRSLLDSHEYTSALEYLNSLQNSRSLNVFCVTSHHPVVDAVLNQKYQAAVENDITVHVNVNDLSAISIPVDELGVLLSNVMDNAIEACEKLQSGREIKCSMILEESLFLSVCNTSLPVTIEKGCIETSKKDPYRHGYGIPTIRYLLDKLQAEYVFQYADGWFIFSAEIPVKGSY